MEVILGLDSILKSTKSVRKNKTKRVTKKHKIMKRIAGSKRKSSPCITTHEINISTERLKVIINSLALI